MNIYQKLKMKNQELNKTTIKLDRINKLSIQNDPTGETELPEAKTTRISKYKIVDEARKLKAELYKLAGVSRKAETIKILTFDEKAKVDSLKKQLA